MSADERPYVQGASGLLTVVSRYLLFEFSEYYPHGGWSDLTAAFDSLVEALESRAAHPGGSYYQVVDLSNGQVVSTNCPEEAL